jgi:hypothetical protein
MSSAARELTANFRAIIGAETIGLETANSARAGSRAFDRSPAQRRTKPERASASRSCSASPARAAAVAG